jgi:hypothetical protein
MELRNCGGFGLCGYELVVPNEKQITKKKSIRTKEKNDGIAKIQRVYSGSSKTRFETIGAERFRRGDG